MGFIVQQLRYIIFFVFIVLHFPKPMSCQMQKRITSKTAADFSLRASGHWQAAKSSGVATDKHHRLLGQVRKTRLFWQVSNLQR